MKFKNLQILWKKQHIAYQSNVHPSDLEKMVFKIKCWYWRNFTKIYKIYFVWKYEPGDIVIDGNRKYMALGANNFKLLLEIHDG